MILSTVNDTEAAGRALSAHIKIGDVIALSGDLGAGKTSFTRGLLCGLGLVDDVPSPTFAIVIPYDLPDVTVPVWHVDLYRLASAPDIYELGLDEARNFAAIVIEWPERMGARLWPDTLNLQFSEHESGGRCLTIAVPPSWEGRCPLQ